jgi:hypothetical protein
LSNSKRNLAFVFYWLGVVMASACVFVVVATNTVPDWRLSRAPFPLSWTFAGLAILAFLATELCHHASARDKHQAPKVAVKVEPSPDPTPGVITQQVRP